MLKFQLIASKDGKAFEFNGTCEDDRFANEMLLAMREGLEANGFEGEIKLSFVTEVTI